jgi:oligoribonuclease NrnB/cAMP/cGMP phosphodiesterase (DHH superfamily)
MPSDAIDCLITHKDCADGFCCFWQVKKAFPDVEVLFANYGDLLPDAGWYDGKRVLIADFSYPPEQMAVIAAKAKSVVCLDHHRSAIRKWDGQSVVLAADGAPDGYGRWSTNVEWRFDEKKSGAMLVWECLNQDKKDQPRLVPWLVRFVQDRDLWKWELPDSRAISAYIASVPKTMEAWDALDVEFQTEDGLKAAAKIGGAILRTNEQYIDGIVIKSSYWSFAEGEMVSIMNTTHLYSEVGERMSKGVPFSVTYWDDRQRGVRKWSLRSQKDGGTDVSMVAEQLGGGGHPNAAGFQSSVGEPFEATMYRVGEAYKSVKSGKKPGGE